ncbi:MAG TPA: hypothetical protein VGN85_04440 [Methyloceanibacter sp.]|nr:hypothetical protein [Methyloceanibacter sp.]
MSIRSAILSPLLLVAAVSLAFAEDQPTTTPPPEEPQWTEFQSPERGFAVSFPGTPKVTSTPVEGQNPLLQHDFQVNVGEDVYSVVVFEYPAGKAPNPPATDFYVKLVNAYAKGSESRLRKRGPATIAGHSGFEAIADDGKGKFNHLVDVVPAGDRIYMLATAGPKNHATGDDAARFRDSFRLLGDETQSQSAAAPGAPPGQ